MNGGDHLVQLIERNARGVILDDEQARRILRALIPCAPRVIHEQPALPVSRGEISS